MSNWQTTSEPGPDTVPVAGPVLGQRCFIPSLHIPNAEEWYGVLAGLAHLSSKGTPQQIIDQEVVDDLMEKAKERTRGKGKRARRRR